jgi:hypothetical protein
MPDGARPWSLTATFLPSSFVKPAPTCDANEHRPGRSKHDAGAHRVLSRAQRCRHRNLPLQLAAVLHAKVVKDRLGRVNGRAAADGDDVVRTGRTKRGHARADSGDWGMLADIEERIAVRAIGAQGRLNLLHDVCLLVLTCEGEGGRTGSSGAAPYCRGSCRSR